MNVEFQPTFLRDLKKINDKSLKKEVETIITIFEKTALLSQIKSQSVKKLQGNSNAYRIRIGDYRLGFYYEHNVVCFARLLHRKDIYKNFP